MTPQQFREAAHGKRLEAKTLIDAATAEDRELTEDEEARADALLAESDDLQAQAEKKHTANQRLARLEAGLAESATPPPPPPRAPIGGDIEVVGPRFEADVAAGGFAKPRDFFLAVMTAGHGKIDDRLIRFRATVGSDEQSTFSDPYGGFLIPEAFAPNILSTPGPMDPIAGLTTSVPMAASVVNMNARVDKDHSTSVSGGLRVYRVAEADTVAASRKQFEKVRLEATMLMGLAYATEQVLRESPESFVALLEAGFRDEFGAKILAERLDGTGVGQYVGVNNAPGKIDVSKETGQLAATIVAENIINMRARCHNYGNAVWLCNPTCLPQLMTMVMEAGASGWPMWQMSLREDRPDTLLGRPLLQSEFCQVLGTAGDLILGDWSQYLEGIYEPIQSASSIHVRFENHEQTFKFWTQNAGAPWWRTVLTPRNGDTLAPFVRIETRS